MPARAPRPAGAEDGHEGFVHGFRETLVELSDEAVGVEGEGIRVAAQKRPRVGAAREDVETIFLERSQIPLAQARQALGIRKDEALRLASRSQTRTDLKQGSGTVAGRSGRQGSASSTLPSCRTIPSIRTLIGSPSR